MSMTSLPADKPAATPRSPNSTSATCGVSGTMVMMIVGRPRHGVEAGDDFQALVDKRLGRRAAMVAGDDRIAGIDADAPPSARP